MKTVTSKVLAGVVVVLIVGFILGWVHYRGVISERDRNEQAAAKQYQKLTVKYNTVNTKYTTLRAKKSEKRQDDVIREDKIINENHDYYAGDCFDAIGLQHIQQAQSATAK